MSFSIEQLKLTIRGLETLAAVSPKRDAFVGACEQLGWLLGCADNLVIEFDTPCASPFLVDLCEGDFVAGGFIALHFLEWDKYEGTSVGSENSKAFFDVKYFETVSIVGTLLGKPDSTIVEAQTCQQSAVWKRQNAYIFVLQGADDIEGIDIRLWLEYFDGNDILPDSQVFDWLCRRHLSEIELLIEAQPNNSKTPPFEASDL